MLNSKSNTIICRGGINDLDPAAEANGTDTDSENADDESEKEDDDPLVSLSDVNANGVVSVYMHSVPM